jgi:hypothetical protein
MSGGTSADGPRAVLFRSIEDSFGTASNAVRGPGHPARQGWFGRTVTPKPQSKSGRAELRDSAEPRTRGVPPFHSQVFVALERPMGGQTWRCTSNGMETAPRLTKRCWTMREVRDP